MNMDFERKLTIPSETKKRYPVSEKTALLIENKRREVKDIFEGKDQRMILLIGPCSADNEDAVLTYMDKLVPLQEQVREKILFVPRLYTNKPRTTGEGYKGLLHQPDPNGKPDMYQGLLATRHIHMKAVEQTGFIFADEMLYPENYKYLDDILGYVAVGARSVEDQQHRLTASGIEVPVGMKNPTSGDISVMMNSIKAAQSSHTFIYRGWEAHSHGNPWCHAILRGWTDREGRHQPNYHYEDLLLLCDAYEGRALSNPSCIIDANHSNSRKNPFEQKRIISEVLNSCAYNSSIRSLVKGFMVESYLEDGSQKPSDGVFGKSITDACIGWDKTERLVLEMAQRL